ncbi:CehA/McbA family metallohydrolase [Bacillus sp. FSL K6-3431]|uniref:CehA/McbA family metallohydrolase n=1 Tax=Bacillus sp. FSL K6-3431 TaxID=2921500 RepID=UPI0030F536F6
MNKWLPFELHTHTVHSDGKHTLLEMAEKARELEITGIALTDHNTMSGLMDKEEVMAKTGVYILSGLEWTTFYGHMVTLGISGYADWRNLSPLDIHKGIANVHKQGGLAGIAHPFEIGSPICTGCFWEYQISDWNDVDYIEVWSETFPSIRKKNKRAYDLWIDKLNDGYRISGTSGRDWHVSSKNKETIALTYLNILEKNDVNDKSMIDALKKGRLSITMGPLITLDIVDEQGKSYSIGDEIEKAPFENHFKLKINVDFSVRKNQWKLDKQDLKIRVRSNCGILEESRLRNNTLKCNTKLENVSWVIAELHGVIEGVYTMIGFTNPIYLK